MASSSSQGTKRRRDGEPMEDNEVVPLLKPQTESLSVEASWAPRLGLDPGGVLAVRVLADPLGEAGLGVGSRLWPAATVLGQLLLKPTSLGPEWSALLAPPAEGTLPPFALELGAGTALPSVCLACLGHRVVSTDLPEILPVVRANLEANAGRCGGRASAAALTFGDSAAARALGEVSIVLGSDVAYDPVSYEPLLETLRALGGRWRGLLAISQRQADLGDETFENACRDAGAPLRLCYTAFVGNVAARRVNVYETCAEVFTAVPLEKVQVATFTDRGFDPEFESEFG